MFEFLPYAGAIAVAAAVLLAAILVPMIWRRVVPTNEAHIVQTKKHTTSYGRGQSNGNVYYEWPSWFPVIGVEVIKMPVSNFDIALPGYAAYDKDRLPFVLDLLAFFQIDEPNTASQRVKNMDELHKQLTGILQGATRSILAQAPLHDILEKRAEYGLKFTEATSDQLKAWGVANVKTIELMDIRDAKDSHVVANIMAMKASEIERQSRSTVADNLRAAQEAEINAKRDVDMRAQEALQQVGQRTAEKDKQVGIAKEQAKQEIAAQSAITTAKDVEVRRVAEVGAAEVERSKQVVVANQHKEVAVITAEAAKQQTVIAAEAKKDQDVITAEGQKLHTTLISEGDLAQALNQAKGIEAEGLAKGEAERAMEVGKVAGNIALAKEIGQNEGYQTYLVSVRKVEAEERIGTAQAGALEKADVKVIATNGGAYDATRGVMNIFSPTGGAQISTAIEAFAQTEAGKAVLGRMGVKLPEQDDKKAA